MGASGPKPELATVSVSQGGSLRTITSAAGPQVGARLGQFRVEALIGQGGLGLVYRAYDEKLRRAVALKVLGESSSSAAVHLLEEARAAASLSHRAIAAIYDVQQHEGVVFIVMELVAGTSLRAEMQRGPLAPETVLRHARDVAAGLARAHRSGIVHRDLKPENVMVTPEGEAKILDFGLAREAPEPRAPEPQSPGGEAGTTGVAGTPDYMAPEQARGLRVDARADVFSFGVLLYEMLTGERPFPRRHGVVPRGDEDPADGAWRLVAPLGELAKGAPADLVAIVERCLALEKGARFADGDELFAALCAIEPGTPPRPRRLRPALWAGGALLGAGAIGAIVVGALVARTRTSTVAPALEAVGRRPAVAVIGPPGDALPDLVAAQLATGDALRVVPRDVIDRFGGRLAAGSREPTPEALAKLGDAAGADYVVAETTEARGSDARLHLRVYSLAAPARSRDPVTATVDAPSGDPGALAALAGGRIRALLGRAQLTPAEEEAARALLPRTAKAAEAYARGIACRTRYDDACARDAFQQAVEAEDDFALAHLELSRAFGGMHMDAPALAEATRALELASRLGREQHLVIEAQHAVAARDWRAASDAYRTLFGFFPDNLDYGIAYARAQVYAGQRDEAFATLDRLRAAPRTALDETRLYMLEEFLSAKVADTKRRLAAATHAKEKADALGASWMSADARYAITEARIDLGDPDVDDRDLEEARAIYEKLGEDSGVVSVLDEEASIKARHGDFAGAVANVDGALALVRRSGDGYRLAHVLTDRGFLLAITGDFRGAEAGFDDARQAWAEIHDDEGVAHNTGNAAYARLMRGELAGARDAFERARSILRRIGMKRGVAEETGRAALAAYLGGDLALASREASDAIAGSREVDAAEETWHALTTSGHVRRAQGDAAGAGQAYAEAAGLAAHAGDADARAEIEVAQALAALDGGDAREAVRVARAAMDRFATSKLAHDEALARAVLVRALAAGGDDEAAARELATLGPAMPGCQLFEARFLERIASAEVAARRGDRDAAARFAAEARTMAEAAGVVPFVLEARLVQARTAPASLRGTLMARLAKDARTAGFLRIAGLAGARMP